MLKQKLLNAAQSIAPQWTADLRLRRWITVDALELKERCSRCGTIEEKVDIVLGSKLIVACQKRTELIALLKRVQQLQPQYVCEIGSAFGGTLFLFCQMASLNAKILSIDMGFTNAQKTAFPKFALPGQRVDVMAADSHSEETLRFVKTWLNNDRFDFLFIDGDHSFCGVRSDYKMYGPLVRPGGLIGLHDINPDFRTRYGTPTKSDVGQVPAFWQEIKTSFANAEELIENPEQDGLGIGVIQRAGDSAMPELP